MHTYWNREKPNSPVKIGYVLVNTLKGLIKSGKDFNMIFSEFFIKILKFLHP